MSNLHFLDDDGTFRLENPEEVSGLYLPLASETGLKSAVTPDLGGDSKLDQETFLLEPVSIEDLRTSRSTRNFWCITDSGLWSATGVSARQEAARFTPEQDESELTAGLMWQTVRRDLRGPGLHAELTSFVPVQENVEILLVRITNIGSAPQEVTGVAAIPIYGRSADNIRDHRNVTSLLHRIRVTEHGILVKPTLSFDEKGHRENHRVYYVLGSEGGGQAPLSFYPTVDAFVGEGGSFLRPRSLCEGDEGVRPGFSVCGREAMGGIRFRPVTLQPGESAEYCILAGVSDSSTDVDHIRSGISESGTNAGPSPADTARSNADMARAPGNVSDSSADEGRVYSGTSEASTNAGPSPADTARSTADIDRVLASYRTAEQVRAALEETKRYWQEKVCVRYHTGDPDFDRLLRWVSFQPFLRRIYGCSFLPHHDYGRGGRGWRDLWQDCLSLLLLDPSGVGDMIKANFGGVRIDGTNATIIGDGDGHFIADRNGIARVWMDHALWPFQTTELYIDQTGDIGILNADAPYFKDAQTARGTETDEAWGESDGNRQRTQDGALYTGSILEHLLIQHLTAFYEVGAHNIFRLRGADWNDALDMAAEHGESVAFTCAYAGNLRRLAGLLRQLEKTTGQKTADLPEELLVLLQDDAAAYGDISHKTALLQRYTARCRHTVSGRKVSLPLAELADDLDGRACWLTAHLRSQEWIDAEGGEGWFNSYYDDHGRPAEGVTENGVRMMLTGQVFAIQSGTATDDQVRAITRSADHYLYRKDIGGYRLNTDFHELKFDLGRMFGFAYGEKENGAVFSHMTVMYANALYRRGFAREGRRALQTLAEAALHFETSRIYPGIPEYFDGEGRGVYHYLTGAASWYMMTMLTEVFGVRGRGGDLVIAPQLMPEQFDENHLASVTLPFAGKRFRVTITNPAGKTPDAYRVGHATLCGPDTTSDRCNGLAIINGKAVMHRNAILRLPEGEHQILIELI